MSTITGARRLSLFEEINRLNAEDDAEVFRLMDEIAEEEDQARGFRWASKSTQSEQDRILRDYEKYLKAFKVLNDTVTDEKEKDSIMFPFDPSSLYLQLRKFMIFVARFCKGRSGGPISYRGYVKYRSAIMFWARRTYSKYDRPPIPTSTLFNKLTEAMRASTKRYKLSRSGKQNITQVGLAELRQLLDYDISTTPNLPFAEGQELAWCIGRVCSVRPGSIGPSTNATLEDKPYLIWRDITITRGKERGQFQAQILFRSLKTNIEDPETGMRKPEDRRTMKCTILPPTSTDNIVFSIPHRLLIIALRRGILNGINDVSELFDGELHNITINDDHLDQPVIFASGPRGLTLSNEPSASAKLSSYLQLRGQKLGYEHSITFYSIRRRSATDLTRQIGAEGARALMNHDPDSRVLEKYYVNLQSTTDVSTLGLGEADHGDPETRGASIIAENNPLAINVLSSDDARRVHGPALNALVRQIIATDDAYPVGGSTKQQKNYRRRVRYAAIKTLLSEEVQKQRAAMTRVEFDKRLDALNKSGITSQVLAKAKETMSNDATADEADEDENTDIDPESGDFVEANAPGEVEEEALEDQQGTPEGADILGVVRQTDEGAEVIGEDDEDQDEEDPVPYDTAVEAFMTMMLSEELSKHHDFKNRPVACPLCEEDETAEQDRKNKTFSNESHLNDHMESYYHTPKAHWVRMMTMKHSGPEDIPCEYCEAQQAIDPDHEIREYSNLKALMVHIENSTEESHGEFHDNAKRKEGWYEPGWGKNQSRRKQRRDSEESVKNIKKTRRLFGITYSKEVELLAPKEQESDRNILRGGPWNPPTAKAGMEYYQGDLMDLPLEKEIPKRFQGVIEFGTPFQPSAIPAGMEDYITFDQSIKPVPLTRDLFKYKVARAERRASSATEDAEEGDSMQVDVGEDVEV